MFIIHMPKDFKIGETRDVRINQMPQRLTWRDEETLVIEPSDARTISRVSLEHSVEGDLLCFICGDVGDVMFEPLESGDVNEITIGANKRPITEN
jgi:hypothetical protein